MGKIKTALLEHYCSYCDSSFEEMLDLLSHLKEIHGV